VQQHGPERISSFLQQIAASIRRFPPPPAVKRRGGLTLCGNVLYMALLPTFIWFILSYRGQGTPRHHNPSSLPFVPEDQS